MKNTIKKMLLIQAFSFLMISIVSLNSLGQTAIVLDSLDYSILKINKSEYRDSLRKFNYVKNGTYRLPIRLEFFPIYNFYLDTLEILLKKNNSERFFCVKAIPYPNQVFEMPIFRGKKHWALVYFYSKGYWQVGFPSKSKKQNKNIDLSPTITMLRNLDADYVFVLTGHNRYGYKKNNEFYIIQSDDKHVLLSAYLNTLNQ
jgi:hypothetical protein